MALPKLSNDRPIYEMVVPSTKETVKYRPFLVKEQKSLLVAFESQDQKQILNSMLACIESCVPGVDVMKLATFDVDYMFTQVRSKSVGETSTVLSACTECREENEVKINIALPVSLNSISRALSVSPSVNSTPIVVRLTMLVWVGEEISKLPVRE